MGASDGPHDSGRVGLVSRAEPRWHRTQNPWLVRPRRERPEAAALTLALRPSPTPDLRPQRHALRRAAGTGALLGLAGT